MGLSGGLDRVIGWTFLGAGSLVEYPVGGLDEKECGWKVSSIIPPELVNDALPDLEGTDWVAKGLEEALTKDIGVEYVDEVLEVLGFMLALLGGEGVCTFELASGGMFMLKLGNE